MEIKHIPLIQKSLSTDISDNFFYQYDNIYLMDNHRLALWAWIREIDLGKKYNLIHIDAHPDMSKAAINDYQNKNLKIENMSLDEYRTIEQDQFKVPLFRWDNYLPIFQYAYAKNFINETSLSFTHHQGSKEALANDLESIYLLREMENIFTDKIFINDNQWIVNLDLDYFFASQPSKTFLFSDEYISLIGKYLKIGLDKKIIKVLTIAFSPECCGSWENAEFAFNKLNKELNIPLKL